MANAVYKKTAVVGTSAESFSAAAAAAVEKAGETIRNMRWFEVTDQRGKIVDGKVAEYQVTLLIGFHLE
jgi:hypothetical protein